MTKLVMRGIIPRQIAETSCTGMKYSKKFEYFWPEIKLKSELI